MDPSQRVGDVVDHSYTPGWIVLAYLVSITGCWTTLELLHRRTSNRGLYNWCLILAAAIVMGAVGVWGMHFIGNLAIQMGKGEPEIQIQYSPGFTVGSFFTPIVVLIMSFYYFGTSKSVTYRTTLIGGTMTGLAVVGMHYMSQIGLANYHASYHPAYVAGSVTIALIATTGALGTFFYLTATWTDNWIKRVLCAALMAGSVSGMHWVGTLGCTYRLLKVETATGSMGGLSRKATAIVLICTSVGCCIGLITLALLGQRSRKLSADRAQQVVLACATFDMDGRLMVTTEGLLPCRKIIDSFAERSFDGVFDVNHHVFGWIFKASRCWQYITDLVPAMRRHVKSSTLFLPESGISSSGTREDYATLFKELFCVTASDLANLIQVPLEDIGLLHSSIMRTGTLQKNAKWKYLRGFLRRNRPGHVEIGESATVFGRGQLLFLVRRVPGLESGRLQALGYRFASISNVAESLARSMEITQEQLRPQLESMRAKSEKEHFLKPGVYLACFALRPIFKGGFDILVHKHIDYLLPTVRLLDSKLEDWQLRMLQTMNNWTVATCRDKLRSSLPFVQNSSHSFIRQLYDAITALASQIQSPFFQTARLVARPFPAPQGNLNGRQSQQQAYVVAFRTIADTYQLSTLYDLGASYEYKFVPSKLFLVQQHAYKNSADNDIFGRRIRREFAAVAERCESFGSPNSVNSRPSFRRSIDVRLSNLRRRGNSTSSPQSSSWPSRKHSSNKKPLDDPGFDDIELTQIDPSPTRNLGGIYVLNEVRVDSNEMDSPGATIPDIEAARMGLTTEASIEDVEPKSWADDLMILTTNERRRQRISYRRGDQG